MKYHATVSNIIASLLLLAAVAVPAVAVMGSAATPRISERIVAGILDRIEGQGDTTVSIGSIDGSLFSAFVLDGVSVMDGTGKTIFHVERLTIDEPVYRLILPSLMPEVLDVSLQGLRVDADEADVERVLAAFNWPGDQTSGDGTTHYRVSVTDGELSLALRDFWIHAGEMEAFAMVDSEGHLVQAKLSTGSAGVGTTGMNVSADRLTGNLGETADGAIGIRLSIDGALVGMDAEDSSIQAHHIEASLVSSAMDDLMAGTGTATFAIRKALFDGQVQDDHVLATVDSVAGSIDLYALHPEAMECTLSGIDARYGLWEASLPSAEATIAYPGGEFETGTFRFRNPVSILHDGDSAAILDGLSLEAGRADSGGSLRIAWDTADFSSPASLAKTFGISIPFVHHVEINDSHVLVLSQRDAGTMNGEASFSTRISTDIPYVKTIEATVAGDLVLDGEMHPRSGSATVEQLRLSGVPGIMQAQIASADEDQDGESYGLRVSHDDGIQATVNYSTATRQIKASLRFNDTSPWVFRSIIGDFFPTINAFLSPETLVEGNANFTVSDDLQNGRGTAEIGIADLTIEGQRFNLATTFTGSMDPMDITVDLATATTEGLRLSYIGSIHRQQRFPEGMLHLNRADSGDLLVSVDFTRSGVQSYGFRVISPLLPETTLDGDVSWAGLRTVSADTILSVPGARYGIGAVFDFESGIIELASDAVAARIDPISNPGHVALTVSASSLVLPETHSSALHGSARVTGDIAADISLADGLYIIDSKNIFVEGLSWGDLDPWSLSFAFEADPRQINISQLNYVDGYGEIEGNARLFNDSLLSLFTGTFSSVTAQCLLAGTMGERVELSVFPDAQEPGIGQGSLVISRFPLGRFIPSLGDMTVDCSLVGATDLAGRTEAHAAVGLSANRDGGPLSAHVDLHVDDAGVVLDQGRLSYGKLVIDGFEGELPFDGPATVTAGVRYGSDIDWRDASTRSLVTLSARLPAAGNLYDWLGNLPTRQNSLPPVDVAIADTVLFGSIPCRDGVHRIAFHDQTITVEPLTGGTLAGTYRLDTGEMDFRATEGFPVLMHAAGRIGENDISLRIDDISLHLPLLNALFSVPIITIDDGLIKGSLRIEGDLGNPDYYGTLYADTIDATLFFIPEQQFSVKNPVVTISEHLVTLAITPVSATHATGRMTQGSMRVEATLEKWSVPHYRFDIIDPLEDLLVWFPVPSMDLSAEALVSGSFAFEGSLSDATLYADVVVDEVRLGFGLPDLPSWYALMEDASADIAVTTGKNVSFVFPNDDSPIVRATFADNQRLHLRYRKDTKEIGLSGELAFRSGEIYYVQKNFYITEGSLKFPSASGGVQGTFNPTLDLRARLREFDQDGNRIDIFLVLQDARLNNISNINPRFESVPARSTNEILELLGQNIISAGAVGDSGIGSVVAVASAATDMMSRLGLLQTTTVSLGFSRIIRDSLGLDVFTIRSNLLQNILFETLPGLGADTSVSPIARYLDDTTLYLGKYLADDLYLQGMLHFRRDPFGRDASFLADDLSIETELSVEWANQLATFSLFTQPDELSVFNIFDTMGFSITKRFEF